MRVGKAADALLFLSLLSAGSVRGLDGGEDGGVRLYGRVEGPVAGHIACACRNQG